MKRDALNVARNSFLHLITHTSTVASCFARGLATTIETTIRRDDVNGCKQ